MRNSFFYCTIIQFLESTVPSSWRLRLFDGQTDRKLTFISDKMFQRWENMEINRWSNAWIKKVKYYYLKPFRWLQFFTEILTKSMFFPIEKYTIQLFKLTIFSDFLMLFPDMTVVPPMSALSRQLFDVKMAFKIVSNITEHLQYDDCSQFLSMTGLLTSSTSMYLVRYIADFKPNTF